MSEILSEVPAELVRPLEDLLGGLGYLNDPDFYRNVEDVPLSQTRHSVDLSFKTMGVVGAFCPRTHLASGGQVSTPIVYVVVAADMAQADRYHRAIWSQSLVPLVLMVTPAGVQVRNGFDYRDTTNKPIGWSQIGRETRSLRGLRPEALRSATSWRDFGISMKGRLDNRLHADIKALAQWVRKKDATLRHHPNIVNALIGRFIYLYILIDRGIVDQCWIDELDESEAPSARRITLSSSSREPWPAQGVWQLFDAVDTVLNGSIFPISKDERALVSDETVNTIRMVLRSDKLLGDTHQFGFLDVNYASIRTETISTIYELFFELEDQSTKDSDGAFYTPPFLVDYIIDEIDALSPINGKSLVVDPAAGSGAFLVGAFRRIVEREHDHSPTALRNLLISTIWGMELKAQAANVARFGLYLTMLDYLPGETLQSLSKSLRGDRLFPSLEKNLRTADAFSSLPIALQRRASHVIANPPWTDASDDSPAQLYRNSLPSTRPVTKSNLAELFYWRSIDDLAAPHAHVAMVLPTRSLIAPKAKHFPGAVLEQTTVYGVTNLAHMRRKLFIDAEAPATVLFASPCKPSTLAWTWLYSPVLANQPLSADGRPWAIIVDRGNVQSIRQQDLWRSRLTLYRHLMLQPLDRYYLSQIESRISNPVRPSSLGDILDQDGMIMRRGASPRETNLPKALLLDSGANNYLDRLGLSPTHSRSYWLSEEQLRHVPEQHRQLFEGPVLLIPRSQTRYDVVEGPVAFSSTLAGIAFAKCSLSAAEKYRLLSELGCYLRSNVVRYLLALFGRMWVLDQRRFETTDLRKIPLPYASMNALLEDPPSEMTDEQLSRHFVDYFELDDSLVDAIKEHHYLREAYQNGRSPDNSLYRPLNSDEQESYLTALQHFSNRMLGGAAEIRFCGLGQNSLDTDVVLRLDLPGADKGQSPRVYDFSTSLNLGEQGQISIQIRPNHVLAYVTKPNVMAAWTVERAFADSQNVVARLLEANH